MTTRKKTRFDLTKLKQEGQKAVWITAYDYWTASFAEAAGMDMILVGDSLGMCVYGYSGTVPVTMDQCIWHSEAVRRGAPNTFIIGDMPFLSYQVSVPEAVRNAGRFHKEAGVDAIKLEGGLRVCPQIKAIADALRSKIGQIVVGQDEAVDLLLVALLSSGHVLLEGVPGTGKTLLAQTFAQLEGAREEADHVARLLGRSHFEVESLINKAADETANALMTGDYLTTKGRSVNDDIKMIKDLKLEVRGNTQQRREQDHVQAASA